MQLQLCCMSPRSCCTKPPPKKQERIFTSGGSKLSACAAAPLYRDETDLQYNVNVTPSRETVISCSYGQLCSGSSGSI